MCILRRRTLAAAASSCCVRARGRIMSWSVIHSDVRPRARANEITSSGVKSPSESVVCECMSAWIVDGETWTVEERPPSLQAHTQSHSRRAWTPDGDCQV